MLRLGPEVAGDLEAGSRHEWLETNGLGGYAMGTVAGPGTRRYHGLLVAAARPPLGRVVLLARCEEWLTVDDRTYALSANFYPGAVHPDGYRHLHEYRRDPWPTWVYRVGGVTIERTVFMPQGRQMTLIAWQLLGGSGARLSVRPLICGRDYHALHHENPVLRRDVDSTPGCVVARPYADLPGLALHHDGAFRAAAEWYHRFRYPREEERGLDAEEDLFAPGELSFELTRERGAHLTAALDDEEAPDVTRLRDVELARRRRVVDGSVGDEALLRLAADQFTVQRGEHCSVIAGYPWFTDWGRDTFISLPGLTLATGQVAHAGELLLAFAPYVQGGLIPNRFPDAASEPEYNAVDAPLWFVVAGCRFAAAAAAGEVSAAQLDPLVARMRAVVDGYLDGTTRYHIGVDDDGLIYADAPGLQLTWMDAKVGDWVVTPRRGKPVEIQALWVAALEALAALLDDSDGAYARELAERAAWARSSFAASFWSESDGWLYDVIDGPRRDATLRPNQLYALGLCAPLVDGERARRVLDVCERALLTPVGLRSRAQGPGYRGVYIGDQRARDGAYHQGTVWPYLLGIYADACRRVRGAVPPQLFDGLFAHLRTHGTLPEICDGDAPHTPRGCPAQAWSVAETLRVLCESHA